jgi:hypothetical protein
LGAPGQDRNPSEVVLRLAIGRDGAGLELAYPALLGCLTVTELTASLPGIRFPLDVSGGVPRFRHRRGALQTLQIEVPAIALERWAASRLQGLVGIRAPEVWIGVLPAGARVCVAETIDAEDERAPLRSDARDVPSSPIVAFDVDAIADQEDLVFVVKRARGTDLPATATAIAIACAEALLRGVAKREGAMFVVRRGARALAGRLLPEAGARLPSSAGVRWSSVAGHAGLWILHAARGALAASPSDEAVRAREATAMLREGDDALAGGEEETARALYLDVLQRAPRHGEIVRRLLQIDARTPGRAEAALATLAEAMQTGGGHAPSSLDSDFGTTPGELLADLGDIDAAIASFERAGDAEPAPPLAARAFELAAPWRGRPARRRRAGCE